MTPWVYAIVVAGLAMSAPAARAAADEVGAATVETAAISLRPNAYVWDDRSVAAVPGAVTVVISIPDQRAYVYRGQALVAASAVSTGKKGKATPVGMYTILQKKVAHNSNLYNNASMPYMQRLTWDGIALHAGQNPGFPNSHGCIRLPVDFAKKLYEVTDLGTTVMVTDEMAAFAVASNLVSDDVKVAARAEAAGSRAAY